MSGDKINLKIERKEGITQALKRLVEDAGDTVKNSVWNDTIDKLEEINAQRQTAKSESIFSGGTQRSDWPHNFVVHEGNIEFTKEEMNALCDVMQISADAKAKILNTETTPPTQKSPEEEANKLGYTKTNHSGTYYDDKTKTHYQWDEENQTFIERKDIKQINQDGSYYGTDNQEYNTDGTLKNTTSTETTEEPATTENVEETGATQGGEEVEATERTEETESTQNSEEVEEVERAEETQDTENDVETTPQTPTTPTLTKRQTIEKSITDSIEGAEIEIAQVDGSGRPTKGTFKGDIETSSDKTPAKDFTITYKENGSYEVKINAADEKDSCTITYNANNQKESFVTIIDNETVKKFYTYDANGNKTTAKEEQCIDSKTTLTREEKYDSLGRATEYTETTYNNNEIDSQYTDKYTYLTNAKDSTRKFEREGFNSTGSYTQIGQMEGKNNYEINSIKTRTNNDETIEFTTYVDIAVDIENELYSYFEITASTLKEAQKYEKQLLELKDIHKELSNGCSEDRRTEIKNKLVNILKNENLDTIMKEAVAYITKSYFVEEDVNNAIIETKNCTIIERYINEDGVIFNDSQLDKIYHMTVNKELNNVDSTLKFHEDEDVLGIMRGLIKHGNSEQSLRALKQFHQYEYVSDAYPQLSLEFTMQHWDEIPDKAKLPILANRIYIADEDGNPVGQTLSKQGFEETVLPLIPDNATENDITTLKKIIKSCLGANDQKSYHVIELDEDFNSVISNYMMDHLEETFPKVTEKSDWTTERKQEAVNKYVKEFGFKIAKDLGLENPNKIYPGQIIDFSKIEWKEPSTLNWWFWY